MWSHSMLIYLVCGQVTAPTPSLVITSYRLDLRNNLQPGNQLLSYVRAYLLVGLNCSFEAARDRKQGKTEYLEIVSELQRLGVDSVYETLELSVLGHYLTSSLVSLKRCVNFIQGVENFSKCDSRRILQLAATISISSSRRIFLARNSTEWSMDT